MTEEELIQTAARLGTEAVRQLDEERISQRVLARLKTEPAEAVTPIRRGWGYGLAGLAAAAAVVLVLRSSAPTSASSAISAAAPSASVLHELDDLSVSELEAVLESLPATAGATAHPEPASLENLDAKSLERLLRSLEG